MPLSRGADGAEGGAADRCLPPFCTSAGPCCCRSAARGARAGGRGRCPRMWSGTCFPPRPSDSGTAHGLCRWHCVRGSGQCWAPCTWEASRSSIAPLLPWRVWEVDKAQGGEQRWERLRGGLPEKQGAPTVGWVGVLSILAT